MSVNKIIAIASVVHILGIALFLSGFFPVKKSLQGYSVANDIPGLNNNESNKKLPPKVKIVLIVIDALRVDFIPAVVKNTYEGDRMPFVEEMIRNGSALAFVSKAHNPTVTLPRIKALMSGTIPAFMDVILNLHATSSEEDSIIYQAHQAKHKVIFYGDDTWIKLFGKYFHSFEGTNSFFVSDFIEVDHNVSRHLDGVLNQSYWDFLILHYLGLDHIGHLAGPGSSLIRPKLIEMDNIVKKVHSATRQQESIIVITGDHGMTGSGSHGGASPGETETPLIFITKHGKGAGKIEHVSQVDVTSTLSILMGLPIPKNNIGTIIPSVLEKAGLSPDTILDAIYVNANQVANVLKENNIYNLEESMGIVVEAHKEWLKNKNDDLYQSLKVQYQSLINEMGQKLEKSVIGYDMYCLILGFLVAVGALFSVSRIASVKGIATLQEEMMYTKVMVVVPSFIISCATHFLTCFQSSHFLCSSTWVWPVPVLLLTYALYHILQCSYLLPSILSGQTVTFGIELFVVFGALLHVISLGSSSFVEEEHQTWYFLSTTLVILLFLRDVCHMIRSFDVTLELGFLQRNNSGNFSVYRKSLLSRIFYCLGLLVLLRVSRSWNQTGNKWAHLPDIGDNLRGNVTLLSILTVITPFTLLTLLWSNRTVQQCCLILATLGTVAYHLEDINMSGVSVSKQIIAWVVFMSILVHIFDNIYYVFVSRIAHRYSKIKFCEVFLSGLATAWLLLALLLCRSHNLPLYLFMVLQERFLRKLVWNEHLSIFVRTSAYFWTAMAAFFHQGNSNAISTLDVSSGYVGLSSYQPVIVAMLMICNTYSGLVYLLLQYVAQLCQSSVSQVQFTIMEARHIGTLLCIRFCSVAVYLAVLIHLRHHLFIWTVFAPKLLYEGAHSVVFTSFILVILIVTIITKRKPK